MAAHTARTMRTASSERKHNQTRNQGQMYVYGNAVPKPEILPERRRETRPQEDLTTSRQVRRNRKRATSISPGYAKFLVAASVCAVCICIMFLRLQSDIVSRSEHITELQENLADLTEENDTAYQAAENSVNLEQIREKALNELGMVYASQGSVVEYDGPQENSVIQYNDIPEDGILAKSRDVSE